MSKSREVCNKPYHRALLSTEPLGSSKSILPLPPLSPPLSLQTSFSHPSSSSLSPPLEPPPSQSYTYKPLTNHQTDHQETLPSPLFVSPSSLLSSPTKKSILINNKKSIFIPGTKFTTSAAFVPSDTEDYPSSPPSLSLFSPPDEPTGPTLEDSSFHLNSLFNLEENNPPLPQPVFHCPPLFDPNLTLHPPSFYPSNSSSYPYHPHHLIPLSSLVNHDPTSSTPPPFIHLLSPWLKENGLCITALPSKQKKSMAAKKLQMGLHELQSLQCSINYDTIKQDKKGASTSKR